MASVTENSHEMPGRGQVRSRSGGEFHFGRADWFFPLAVVHCSTPPALSCSPDNTESGATKWMKKSSAKLSMHHVLCKLGDKSGRTYLEDIYTFCNQSVFLTTNCPWSACAQ